MSAIPKKFEMSRRLPRCLIGTALQTALPILSALGRPPALRDENPKFQTGLRRIKFLEPKASSHVYNDSGSSGWPYTCCNSAELY